jgi:hypothetical protein
VGKKNVENVTRDRTEPAGKISVEMNDSALSDHKYPSIYCTQIIAGTEPWVEGCSLGRSGQKEEMAERMFLTNDCFAKYTIS